MDKRPMYLQGGRGRGRGENRSTKPKLQGQVHHGSQWSAGWGRGKENRHVRDDLSEKKFEAASAKHKAAVQKHLSEACISACDDDDDDDDDDDQDSGTILNNIFKSFSETVGGEGDLELGKTQEYLKNSLRLESNTCLICIETIKRNEAIWCCECCYCMFHIQCIQKWVKDGVYQHTALSEENFPKRDLPWFCPKCRYEYKQSRCPTKYTCFCAKEVDPSFDPWLVPHSCGQVCSKKLKPDCGHECLLLCHPGPCPPCPKTVRVLCYCQKNAPQTRRCGLKEWSCGQSCGRKLTCGQHSCVNHCHKGDCLPCPKTSSQLCMCGKEKVERPCASPKWQCKQTCGKVLSCGQHTCEEICHAGDCGPCPRAGSRTCPCGKSKHQLPCTEDVPCCGDTCEKVLECGLHTCTQRCHLGLCGSCRQMSIKRCRCGQKEKEVPCFKEYLCEIKCSKIKNCGKHQCKRKCCDGDCPPCEQLCGKTLSCRNHKCNSVCHTGPCYPCPLTVDISCNCGASVVTVPCGREKVTKPPRCSAKCQNPPDCQHEARVSHRCHFGPCPPCRQICHQVLDCSHTCPDICHTAVRTRIQEKVQRAGPWEPVPETKVENVDRPCPPCLVPLPVTCFGGHETSDIPCCRAQPYSCKRSCGRQLLCGNHLCELECHVVQEAPDDKTAGDSCTVCELPCAKPQPEGCSHECLLSCHPDVCPPCKQMIRMRCHCQLTVQHIECHRWTQADKAARNRLKSCPGKCPKNQPCGHQCSVVCHPGECPGAQSCRKKTAVKCPCKRRKQEYVCYEVQNGQVEVQCDDVCKQNKEKQKKIQEEAEKERAEEEKRQQQAELEEYERKTQGRKRKPRKRKESMEEETFWKKYKKIILLLSIILPLLTAVVYMLL